MLVSVAAKDASLNGRIGQVDMLDMVSHWLLIDTDSNTIVKTIPLTGFLEHLDPGGDVVKEALALKPDSMICSGLGPGAFMIAKEAGVRVYQAEKGLEVRVAIENMKKGLLKPLEHPTHAHGTHGRDASGRLIK
ncbi:MAG: NifB/NifX family molybdenum-iron cluster-binding protein [Thaumarchaeota archaeon]|nr:NifB/NifX family molybdenum-iron cluster-binding protein [Nitrososphaerota archaeon]